MIATDEVRTYAIFNYEWMGWTTHTEAGGDTTEGQGGVPAFVGFNAGNGTKAYEYKPYSQQTYIRDLTSTGNANGMPGRHIFRIDEKILPGVCIRDLSTLISSKIEPKNLYNSLLQSDQISRWFLLQKMVTCLEEPWSISQDPASHREPELLAGSNGKPFRLLKQIIFNLGMDTLGILAKKLQTNTFSGFLVGVSN